MKYIKKFERNDLQEFNIINNIYQSILDNVRLKIDNNDFDFNSEYVEFKFNISNYGDMKFLLFWNLKDCGFGISKNGFPFIAIPKTSDKINTNLIDYEDGIKHEISHFLDYKKSGKILSSTTNMLITKQYDRYFNDSQEINAYYTQGLNKVIKYIQTSNNTTKIKKLLNDFKQFKDFFFDNINIRNFNIKDFLSTKSIKKIDKRLYDTWYKMKNLRINESFNNDEDSEMIFIDLIDADVEIKFGEYDTDTVYVDIINPYLGYNSFNPLGNTVESAILNWVEITNTNNYNWWVESPGIRSSGLYKSNNRIYNNKYLNTILNMNSQVRIVVSKSSENLESYFTNLSKDFFVNYNYREQRIYITKNIDYEGSKYSKYRREVTGSFSPAGSGYHRENELRYLRNEKTRRSINIEKEDDSYKKIFYALQDDLINLGKKCRFEVNGKDFIEVYLGKHYDEVD